MAKLRNVSTDTLVVPVLGNRLVEPDEVVEVSDELLEELAWPETTWAVVAPPKKVAAVAVTKDEE